MLQYLSSKEICPQREEVSKPPMELFNGRTSSFLVPPGLGYYSAAIFQIWGLATTGPGYSGSGQGIACWVGAGEGGQWQEEGTESLATFIQVKYHLLLQISQRVIFKTSALSSVKWERPGQNEFKGHSWLSLLESIFLPAILAPKLSRGQI